MAADKLIAFLTGPASAAEGKATDHTFLSLRLVCPSVFRSNDGILLPTSSLAETLASPVKPHRPCMALHPHAAQPQNMVSEAASESNVRCPDGPVIWSLFRDSLRALYASNHVLLSTLSDALSMA